MFKKNYRLLNDLTGDAGGGTPPAAAAAAAPPAATSTVADQSTGHDWMSSIQDAVIRDNLNKNGVKDVASLAKQFVDQQAYLGNAIRIPSEHASEEDKKKFYEKVMKHAPNLIPRPDSSDQTAMEAFYASLGRPESPEKYEDPEIADAPEGFAMAPERAKFFKDIAHRNGLTNTQYKKMLGDVLEADKQAYIAQMTSVKESHDALQREWGVAYQERVDATVTMLEQTGAPEDVMNAVKAGMVGGNTIKWLHGLYSRIGAPEGINNANQPGNTGNGRLTPSEAQSQINEILNNRQHPYWINSHPQHADAVKRVLELGKMADPSASTSIDDLRRNVLNT